MAEIVVRVRESISFSDRQDGQGLINRASETVSLSEEMHVEYESITGEPFALVVEVGTEMDASLRASESFSISETNRVDFTARRTEEISVVDDSDIGPDAVFMDVAVHSGDFSPAEVEDISEYGPSGYGRFKPFRPGQYKFSEAMFKTEMRSLAARALPRIDEMTLTADVDDKSQRGTITVSGAPTGFATVVFSTPFFSVPEVIAVWRSGSSPCTVETYDITETGFKAKLKRISDNVYVNGTFTYAALGY